MDEANDKIDYTAWRKPWRRGLYLYRTTAVISGASAEMYRSFCLNDGHRKEWDTLLVKHELEELRAGSADRRGPAALGGVQLGGWGAPAPAGRTRYCTFQYNPRSAHPVCCRSG